MSSEKRPPTYSDEPDSSEDQLESSSKEKKVCFICGSHTVFIVNIHEPRSGPNMIDVISEKFKMRPLHDDKFLCYSCNNWLINWYTVQKCANRQCESDNEIATTTLARVSGSNSNGSSGGGSSTNDRRTHRTAAPEPENNAMPRIKTTRTGRTVDDETIDGEYQTKRKRIEKGISDTVLQQRQTFTQDTVRTERDNGADEFDRSAAKSGDDFTFTTAVQSVRSKLHKYLYYPNKTKAESDHLPSPLTPYNRQQSAQRSPKAAAIRSKSSNNENNHMFGRRIKCRMCSGAIRSVNRNQKQHTLCRNCKLSVHLHVCNRLSCHRSTLRRNRSTNNCRVKCDRMSGDSDAVVSSSDSIIERDVQSILRGSNIVSKLKSLGTSIYCERDDENRPQQSHDDLVQSSSDGPNEIDIADDTKPSNDGDATSERWMAAKQMITNESNEIVLTFNTVVTEVFPIKYIQKSNADNHSNEFHAIRQEDGARNFSEIIKNVPKSLTITLT